MVKKQPFLTFLVGVSWCLGLITYAHAAPQSRWLERTFNRVLLLVAADNTAQAASGREGAKPYSSRIVKEETTLVLKGQVPSEADVKILQGVIAAIAPGSTFVDKSHVNSAVFERDVWLAGMTFALRQLAKLERGSVSLNDNLIMLDGVAKASSDFPNLEQRLAEELPKGLVLQQVSIKPSADQIPLWTAQIAPGNLAISGYLPKDYDQVLTSYAKASFQNLHISSGVAFGGGGSAEWMEAAKLALDILKLLDQGNASIHNRTIIVEGVASSPATAVLIKGLERRLPRGYHIEANVRTPQQTAHMNSELDIAVRENPALLTP